MTTNDDRMPVQREPELTNPIETEPTDGQDQLRVELAQANAWLDATDPDGYTGWDRALEAAEIADDNAAEDKLRRDLVGRWRDRSDDQLPEWLQLHVEAAPAEGWLKTTDRERYNDWWNAHELANGRAESLSDQQRIVQLWREGTDDMADVSAGRDRSEAEKDLRRSRELRLNRAETWFKENDPTYYRNWKQCREFADSIDDARIDDRALVRTWLQRTGQSNLADDNGLTARTSQDASTTAEPAATDTVGVPASMPATGAPAADDAAAGEDTADPEPNRTTDTEPTPVTTASAEQLTRLATRGPNNPQTDVEEERRAYVEAGARGLHATELAAGNDEPNNAVLAQLGQLRGGGYLHPSTIYAVTSHEHVQERERDVSNEAILRARHALNQLAQPESGDQSPRTPGRAAGASRDADKGPALG